MKLIDKVLIVIAVVFIITNTALSTFLITRSFRAQQQREQTQKVLRQIECMLLIQPQDRTIDNLEACRIQY